MTPVSKVALAVGAGLAWGVIASRLCVKSGKCATHKTGLSITYKDVMDVAGEELVFRGAISKEAGRVRKRALPPGLSTSLMGLQAGIFGWAHLDTDVPFDKQKARFADTAAGGLFYGELAKRWGIGYAVAAHLAHNIGTQL